MTVKKTSSQAASKTSLAKAAPKAAAKKELKPKLASAATGKASGPAQSAKKATPTKPRAASAQGAASSKSRPVKAKPKASPGRPRKSRKKAIFKNKPFIMALLTVLLLGGLGVYWLFSQAPSGSAPQVSEVSRKPDVPLPQVVPKTSAKPSVSVKPQTPAKPVAEQQSKPNQAKVDKPKANQIKTEKPVADELTALTTDRATTESPASLASITPSIPSSPLPKPALPKKPELRPKASLNATLGSGANADDDRDVYETTFGSLLEQSSKDIDSALADVLKNKGFSSKNIKILEVERRSRATDAYYFQKIRLELPNTSSYSKNPALFGQEFAAALPPLLIGAELASPSPRHYIVSVNGLVTHEILLMFYPPDQVGGGDQLGPVTPPPGEALLAIVIDDVGANMNAAKTLVGLNYPVTLAIWPRSEYALQCARLGHAKGLEIMIHQPMEPMEYPKNKPGAGAVFNHMSQGEIIQVVSNNIPLVPYAVGINNHMGSRFTQNQEGLNAVLSAIRGKKLFVLDSVTHGGTIFYNLAKEKGFPAQRRDIFLDVSHDKNAILYQLHKSERLAHSQGYAIAIGHPLPATLEALKEWQHSRDKSVKLVRVQDLIKYKRDNGR